MAPIADVRRAALQHLVDIHGLAEVARRMKKPAAQIKDLLMSRKAFGEKVPRQMERTYDPTRLPGWLDEPEEAASPASTIERSGPRATPESLEKRAADDLWKRYTEADDPTKMLVNVVLARPGESLPIWADQVFLSAVETARLAVSRQFPSDKRRSRKQAGGGNSVS